MRKTFASISKFILFFLTLAMSRPVVAADLASMEILGFSPDARFFAYEQFGRQKQSGFPYSDLFILDTRSGRWVAGSPFRTLLFNTEFSVAKARTKTRVKAGYLLSQMKFADRGSVLASNPVTELAVDPYTILFRSQASWPATGYPYKLQLKTFSVDAPACGVNEGRATGFTLKVTNLAPGSVAKYLVKSGEELEGAILKTCPVDYAVSDVLIFDPLSTAHEDNEKSPGQMAAFVVLIRVTQGGFNGQDGRYIAIARTGILSKRVKLSSTE